MVFLNTYCFVFAWLLLYVYVLGDVLDFVIVLFQNGALKYILFVSAWMLLHVCVLVDVLDFVIVLFQNGVLKYIFICVHVDVATYTCMFWVMFWTSFSCCFRMVLSNTYYLCPRGCCCTCMFWLMF